MFSTADVLRTKKSRLGPRLFKESADPAFFNQVHIIFGGSGAVGGATALQLISFFEEANTRRLGAAGNFPRVVITAKTKPELRRFTSILFKIQQRDHGKNPTRLSGGGYLTAGGVVIDLSPLAIDPDIPELSGISIAGESKQQEIIREFLAASQMDESASLGDKVKLLKSSIYQRLGRPFTDFVLRYRHRSGLPEGQTRIHSVIVSIPLATVASYKLDDLEVACLHLGINSHSPDLNELKTIYLQAIRDDLAHVADELADEVLVAHTTAVGGMYDEESDGTRTIRLGFAHSALDERLRYKQLFADELTKLYAERGIKMLITAAAIGVDSILEHKTPPMNSTIRRLLLEAKASGHRVLPDSDIDQGREVRVYPPLDLDLCDEPHHSISLHHGRALVLDHVLKSGENGFFTVSNTDALYRVMRVTSNSELGLLLARVAVIGDDPTSPAFINNICYYTETDNSRQVFDLLHHPQLRKNQLSGLQPKALQDLGSAKHQGELHTLGLLILLNRLKSLNLESIPPNVKLNYFEPRSFFEDNSQPPALENVLGWDVASLSSALSSLVTANAESDLASIKHYYQTDANRQEAIHRVLREVIVAARAIPSLGTPILYEENGRRRVVAGYYAAPIDRVITHRDSFGEYLREEFAAIGGGGSRGDDEFEKFVEFHIASFGFADIRPLAVLVTARTPEHDLSRNVQIFRDEQSFVAALRGLEPYSYFTTSGLLALLVRLKGLYRVAHELDLELGSANEFRSHFYYDDNGRALLVPGVVEAFRMVSEGLEKNTGSERLDGYWGYHVPPAGAEG